MQGLGPALLGGPRGRGTPAAAAGSVWRLGCQRREPSPGSLEGPGWQSCFLSRLRDSRRSPGSCRINNNLGAGQMIVYGWFVFGSVALQLGGAQETQEEPPEEPQGSRGEVWRRKRS